MKSALRFLLAVIATLLVSCIDGHEEYWLESDGSGRAEITYTLPAAAVRIQGGDTELRKQITEWIQKIPGLTSCECYLLEENNQVTITVKTEFESALEFKKLAEEDSGMPSAATHLMGEIRADIHGRTLDFSRTISASKALPGASFLPDASFEGRQLSYIMHLPAAALESNATRTENNGRTLIWEVPLANALKTPVITRFRMNIPIPWKIVTAIAVPLSLLGGFAFHRFRKSRRIRESEN
jgi:hypothetical protein